MSSPLVPTEHDIKSVKKLAERLKGSDDAETLVNTLEWLDRNMTYWTERAYLDFLARFVLTIGLSVITFLVFFPMLLLLYTFLFVTLGLPPHQLLIVSLSLATYFVLLMLSLVKMSPSAMLLLVAIGSLIIYNLMARALESQHVEKFISSFLNLGIAYWVIAGGAIFIFSYLFVTYLPLTRYLEGVPKPLAALRLIDLTFSQGLPITYMLKLRMGVCRDYAKLTASILINLLPSCKIFFFIIPLHVATGVEINERMYVLDQKLPIMSPEAWLNRWKRGRPSKVLILLKEGERLIVKPTDKQVHRRVSIPFNLDKDFSELVEKTFDAIAAGKPIALHVFAGYAKLFDVEDKAIRESMMRKVRIVLERELASKISLMRGVDLTKQGDDLVVTVAISHNSERGFINSRVLLDT